MARIEFHAAGFRALLTDASTKALVKSEAEKIAEKANAVASTTDPAAEDPYYEVEDGSDGERARFRVATAQGEQLKRNARHEAKTNALQKSI